MVSTWVDARKRFRSLRWQKALREDKLQKKYRPGFLWGQLVSWFKQTIYDPSASLSADRRGSMSLPDPESAFSIDSCVPLLPPIVSSRTPCKKSNQNMKR